MGDPCAKVIHPTTRNAIVRHLAEWFTKAKRDLPWRIDANPYRIWLSEIMAQQTRLDTVTPYFERFIQVFPTVHHLARAPLDRVLANWSGLGYYSRARNLHAAAKLLVERHAGELPPTAEQLGNLPGIGAYTAGAIASIAFGQAVPVVDGNVTRVLSRLFDLELDVTKTAGRKRVWELAAALVPANHPGRFNESLMELGALVCAPIGPACNACPLARFCQACKRGLQAERPVQTPKRPPKPVQVRTAWIRRPDEGLLLLRSPPSGLFGGLWNLPMFPQDASPSRRPLSLRAFRTALQTSLGIELVRCEQAARLTHQLTHRLLQISVSDCALGSGPLQLKGFPAAIWVNSPAELAKVGISSLTRKVLDACGDPLLELGKNKGCSS